MLDQGACSFDHPLRLRPLALRSQEEDRPGRGGSSLVGAWAALKQGDPMEAHLVRSPDLGHPVVAHGQVEAAFPRFREIAARFCARQRVL